MRLELLYMEVINLNNITGNPTKLDAFQWAAYNLIHFARKKPSLGKNNVVIDHGFSIKTAFELAVDEGYCVVLKPSGNDRFWVET